MASDESLEKKIEDTVSAEDTLPSRAEAGPVILPGNLLAGRYRVLGEIGRGGMGVVYRVEQVFLKEVQALKVLSALLEKTNIARFQKEAKTCRLLDHPNLIRIYDFALLEDGSPYLAMELVDGLTLSQELTQRGFFSQKEAIEIFIQVLD